MEHVTHESPGHHTAVAPMLPLTPAQTVAVEALAAGAKRCEAARAAGVERRSVWRWFKDPRFTAALAARRREQRSIRAALVDIAADPRLDARMRLRACELLSDPYRQIADGDLADADRVQALLDSSPTRLKRLRQVDDGGASLTLIRYRQRQGSRQEAPEAPEPA